MVKIRRANKKDLENVAEILRFAYNDKPYYDKWTKETAKKKVEMSFKYSKILVAEEDSEVVGFVIYHIFHWNKGLAGSISDICIKKNLRGKGIGKKLLAKAEKNMIKMKVKQLWLEANPKAKVFKHYEKRGYKKTGYLLLRRELK